MSSLCSLLYRTFQQHDLVHSNTSRTQELLNTVTPPTPHMLTKPPLFFTETPDDAHLHDFGRTISLGASSPGIAPCNGRRFSSSRHRYSAHFVFKDEWKPADALLRRRRQFTRVLRGLNDSRRETNWRRPSEKNRETLLWWAFAPLWGERVA